uniref:Uncharacterized protein n=1 Tax=Arundo donax TaxID=35708 RepID=A0A0A9FIQ0_ARUDO
MISVAAWLKHWIDSKFAILDNGGTVFFTDDYTSDIRFFMC